MLEHSAVQADANNDGGFHSEHEQVWHQGIDKLYSHLMYAYKYQLEKQVFSLLLGSFPWH